MFRESANPNQNELSSRNVSTVRVLVSSMYSMIFSKRASYHCSKRFYDLCHNYDSHYLIHENQLSWTSSTLTHVFIWCAFQAVECFRSNANIGFIFRFHSIRYSARFHFDELDYQIRTDGIIQSDKVAWHLPKLRRENGSCRTESLLPSSLLRWIYADLVRWLGFTAHFSVKIACISSILWCSKVMESPAGARSVTVIRFTVVW